MIDGFGNKTPGARRVSQYRSAWDVLHPGRLIAERLGDSGLTAEAVVQKLRDYFAGLPVPTIPVDEAVDAGATEEDETDQE